MAQKRANPEALRQLAEIFRQQGANEPEAWARSQLEEGIPQLAIFCFSKALWGGVVEENDSGWIDREIEWARTYPRDPCAQAALDEDWIPQVSAWGWVILTKDKNIRRRAGEREAVRKRVMKGCQDIFRSQKYLKSFSGGC